MEQTLVNFKIYEDANEYDGIADVQLPDLSSSVQTVSGAGITGNIEVPVIAHYDAMTMTINFTVPTLNAAQLAEPRMHQIDIRGAIQDENKGTGELTLIPLKEVMKIIPKTTKGGKLAPASTTDGSGDYAVHYWAEYRDGEKVLEIDPLNSICVINGTDYGAALRTALGVGE